MSIIIRDSIGSFNASFVEEAEGILYGKTNGDLEGINTFNLIEQATRKVQAEPLNLLHSAEPRGIALKSLKLTKGFEGFLQKMLNPTNEIYFLSWAWDMSGKPIQVYPEPGQALIIPMEEGEIRQFLGEGVPLFNQREITAGISLRINIWESDGKARNTGKVIEDVIQQIRASKLNNLLTLVGAIASVQVATLTMIKEASLELAGLIGMILKSNSDDYVDFYEGYFPASSTWIKKAETYKGHASEITLSYF